MGSRRFQIAVASALFVGALIAVPSLASRTLTPVLALVGAIPPAVITGFLVYVLPPRTMRLRNESPRKSSAIAIASWIGAAIGMLLFAFAVQGLFVYAGDLKRRDPTAGGDLGAVILIFGLAVVFSSWLIMRSVPIRARWTTAIAISVLIGASWIVGLGLSSGS